MKKIVLILCFPTVAFAQLPQFNWAISFGGGLEDQVQDIRVDLNGNVYSCGYFGVTADFDPGPGTHNITCAGITDAFITKSDMNGNYLWAFSIGAGAVDEATGMALDPQGNIVVAGNFDLSPDFDPGPGVFTMTPSGSSAGFIAKYDSNMNLVWAIHPQSIINGYCEMNDIAIDGTGNIYVCGAFNQTVDFDPGNGVFNATAISLQDMFVAKYSSSGNLIWVKTAGWTSGDFATSLAIDGNGNVAVTGYIGPSVDMDPGPATVMLNLNGSSVQIFLASYASNGNLNWAFDIGNPTQGDMGYAVEIDANSNIALTGFITNTADFDPASPVQSLTSIYQNQTLFLAKYNSSGQYLIAFLVDAPLGGKGLAVDFDAQGGMYFTGYYNGAADFDPSASQYILPACIGGFRAYLAHYSASGTFISAQYTDGTVISSGFAVRAGNNSDVYWGGGFAGTQDFDPGIGVHNLIYNGGKWDAFVAHYHTGVKESVDEYDQLHITCYPNPATELLTISLPATISDFNIRITDMLGQEVYRGEAAGNSVVVNTGNFAEGTYTVLVEFGEQVARRNFVVMK